MSDAALRFYSEVLQLPLLDALSGDDWGGRPWLMMFFGTGSGQLLALCALRGARPPPPDGLPADVRHFAFSVPGATQQQRWREQLERHGVPYTEEQHGRQHSLYFRDPNGIMREVTTPDSVAGGAAADAALQRARRWIEAGAPAGRGP